MLARRSTIVCHTQSTMIKNTCSGITAELILWNNERTWMSFCIFCTLTEVPWWTGFRIFSFWIHVTILKSPLQKHIQTAFSLTYIGYINVGRQGFLQWTGPTQVYGARTEYWCQTVQWLQPLSMDYAVLLCYASTHIGFVCRASR